MNKNASTGFLLGYGSYCEIGMRSGEETGALTGGVTSPTLRVPLLNASYERAHQVPVQGTFYTPLYTQKGGKFRTGVGVYAYHGELAFELTDELRDLIFDYDYSFFQRRTFLDIRLCDGEGEISIPGCVWSYFNLNAEVGSAVNCSLSFASCNGYVPDITVGDPSSEQDYSHFPELQPYWKYGQEGVQSFGLAFSRNVSPIYLNEASWIGPTYLRVGLMEAKFNITCWKAWFDHNELILGDRTLTFTDAHFQDSRCYQFAGISGEGMKTYTNSSTSLRGDGDLFTIA